MTLLTSLQEEHRKGSGVRVQMARYIHLPGLL